MAKKTVATLQKGASKSNTKVVRMIKSEKTGAYSFKEEIIPADKVKEYLKNKPQ